MLGIGVMPLLPNIHRAAIKVVVIELPQTIGLWSRGWQTMQISDGGQNARVAQT